MTDVSPRLQSADVLLPLLVGASDGLVVPFIVSIALQAAEMPAGSICLWGLLFTFVSALIFTIVSHSSARSQHSANNAHDSAHVLQSLGLNDEDVIAIQAGTQAEHQLLRSLHQPEEKYDAVPRQKYISLLCGAGYLSGGLYILTPYAVLASTGEGRLWSVILTLAATVIVGMVRARLTNQSPVTGALRLSTIGFATAAITHYIICLLFR